MKLAFFFASLNIVMLEHGSLLIIKCIFKLFFLCVSVILFPGALVPHLVELKLNDSIIATIR